MSFALTSCLRSTPKSSIVAVAKRWKSTSPHHFSNYMEEVRPFKFEDCTHYGHQFNRTAAEVREYVRRMKYEIPQLKSKFGSGM
jgi:hypothetical protein